MSKPSFRCDYTSVITEPFEDIRKQVVAKAWRAFERNKVPGVAYGAPELVERDNSFFIDWKPVGLER